MGNLDHGGLIAVVVVCGVESGLMGGTCWMPNVETRASLVSGYI